MKFTRKPLAMNLQRFAEGDIDNTGGGNTEAKIKLGDSEFTQAELLEKMKSYDKLEKQFTKVSQENSELKKMSEPVQKWIDFDRFVSQYPPEVQQKFIENVNTFFTAVQTGNVTQKDITGLDKAIGAAQKEGDTKTADQLTDLRDDAVAELLLDKEISSIGKQAKTDGIDFDEDDFRSFLVKQMEEDGFGEDDVFDLSEVKKMYRLYKAEKKAEAAERKKKGDLPRVGTGGTGASVSSKQNNKDPKSIKEAAARARELGWG